MAIVSVLAELERIGWGPIKPLSGDEIKVRCAFHDDHDPSCTINVQKLLFSCKVGSCGAEGDFVSFLAKALNVDRATIFADLSKRYDLEQVKPVEVSVIERDHQALWEQKHLLHELYVRGVTDLDIRKYRLGYHKGRITIPVKNEGGVYVNRRRYLPGAPSKDKMLNDRGRGAIRLYGVDELSYPTIMLCGGEIKKIVASRQLNQHDVGCVAPTAGEGKWHQSFTEKFRGKKVYVCMDVDKAGVEASLKYAAILRPIVPWIGIVTLPLDLDRYPKGDVNDYVAKEGGDLWQLLQTVTEWFPAFEAPKIDDDESPADKQFGEVIMSVNVGRRMRFDAVVSAAVDKPFVVPKRILVDCDKSQDCCAVCGVFRKDDKVFHVSPESPAILQMIDVGHDKLDAAVRAALSIPKQCGIVKLQTSDYYQAWDVRINPSLEITNRQTDRTMQQAICVECDADLNSSYKMTGRLYPHPRTQAATLLLSKSEATHDALSKYEPRDLPSLRVFRPVEWTVESIQERLDDVYADLSSNVTRIYLRQDIHFFVDLAYHSALVLDIGGKRTKGWVEVLVAGDTRHGKSEVATRLRDHYQLGELVPCKSASPAGLLGGLRQIGTQWYVSWGVIPQNDKRLVILEELKGASIECIASLTDMRSSGIAQTTKIEKRRTSARTRLIGLSNPRGNRKVASYAFGVELIRDLIGAPEDVSRFDAALIVADSEIDSKALSAIVRDPPVVRHRYTSELCRDLILWAWTRTDKEVKIPKHTLQCVMEESNRLTQEFSDVIPLVDRGSTGDKLCRLATALAARTFSTGDSELECLVRPCHVQYVSQTLSRVYSSKVFGYKYFSEAVSATTQMIDDKQVKAYLQGMQFPEEVRSQMLYSDELDIADLQDFSGVDREEAQRLLSLLVRKRCVKRRENKKYYKTPDFIATLKAWDFSVAVPKHVNDDSKEEKF